MKTPITNSIRRFKLTIPTLLTAIALVTGCAGLTHHPDPLAGWKIDFNHQPDQAIVKDYQDYIQKLSLEERKSIAYVEYFKDETGQHAIKITIGLNGANWRHVLFYDRDSKRIKTIKYISGHSRS